MDDDEMSAMEEGILEEDDEMSALEEGILVEEENESMEERSSNKTEPVEIPVIEEEETKELENDPAEGEGAKETGVTDVDLEIRDEDEGRPLSSTSRKSVRFADTLEHEDQTKKSALGRMVRGMWASREMLEESSDKQLYMKTTLRELVLYCIFLFVIVYMTFGQYSQDFYILRSRIDQLFENQGKVTQMKSFWEFVEGDLLNGLYWEKLYNKGRKNTRFRCPSTGELAQCSFPPCPCPVGPTDRNMMYENRMLGVPRMRQLKVTNTSCLSDMNKDFKSAIRKCYAPYGLRDEDEDRASYIPEHRKYTEESAWIHQSADQLQSVSMQGKLSTYQGGGYVQNLHFERNVSEALLRELKTNRWLERGTRLVTIDFTVYNANINLFAVIKLIFEFPATGGIIPSKDIQIVKLLKYAQVSDYLLMAAEGIFCLFIIYYCIEEFFEIRAHGFGYFTVFGNILDCIVIGTSVTQIILNFYTQIKVANTLDDLMKLPFEFADFSRLSDTSKTYTYLAGFNVFVAWLKIFKYLSFNKTMTQLSGTLSQCSKELSGFTVMFMIIFFAFAQLGFLLFGTQVEDFNNFINACYTLFRTILGDFNFVVIEQADTVFGPIYFLSYIFFVFFVLLNMFLAIINDTYGEVKADLKRAKPAFQLGDFFMVGVNNMKGFAGIQDRGLDVENAIKMAAEDDGFVTYQELRENLKHSNFSDVEVDMFFNQLSEDPSMADVLIDEEEARAREIEEERLAEMQRALEEDEFDEDDEDEEDDEDDEEEDDLNKSQVSRFSGRPMSGKEARMARSARIRAGLHGSQPLDAERFYSLTERMGRMEATIGPILSKLDSVLGRLDSMKRARIAKRKKLLESIQGNNQLNESQKSEKIKEMMEEEES